MKRIKSIVIFVCAVFSILFAFPQIGFAEDAGSSSTISIKEWEIQWFNDKGPLPESPSTSEPWMKAGVDSPATDTSNGYKGMWVHVVIPSTTVWKTPGLFINQMYGLDITVFEEKQLIFHSIRDFNYERNTLLLTLNKNSDKTNLYIRVISVDRMDLVSPILIGEYDELSQSFLIQELPSLMLGSSVAIMALIMLIISGYLTAQQRKAWIALSLTALAASIMIITNSSLPYPFLKQHGKMLLLLFDLSMIVVFPALHMYAATIFEGRLAFYHKFGRWFAGYSAFCCLISIINYFVGNPFYFFYKLFTFYLLAPALLIHLILILSQSVIQSIRGNRNSLILAIGFLTFAIMFVADLLRIMASISLQIPYLWKLGIVMLIISLIIVLARRISADHKKLVSYTKELELFNGRLQREEKLKFISELAASIAHEVRNPLQVTRGFLQLISNKSEESTKPHFSMAIDELDRASTIITDFLTFAKPELDNNVTTMDLHHELMAIVTIISPMAALSGASLQVDMPNKFYTQGNPSKFKQAILNMVKNSIEAIEARENGTVKISMHEEKGKAVIRISDNGEGMEADQIAKLGEPYYSTKTKGTGLGLMVTFRIIEVMNGTLEFRSEKGKGTEALIRFPLIHKH